MEQQGEQVEASYRRRTSDFQRLARRHDAAEVRTWARAHGIEVSPTGGLPRYVYDLYEQRGPDRGR